MASVDEEPSRLSDGGAGRGKRRAEEASIKRPRNKNEQAAPGRWRVARGPGRNISAEHPDSQVEFGLLTKVTSPWEQHLAMVNTRR